MSDEPKVKPEMSWDWDRKCFLKDGVKVSLKEARARWEAVDSGWTMGAYNRMMSIVMKEGEKK